MFKERGRKHSPEGMGRAVIAPRARRQGGTSRGRPPPGQRQRPCGALPGQTPTVENAKMPNKTISLILTGAEAKPEIEEHQRDARRLVTCRGPPPPAQRGCGTVTLWLQTGFPHA